MMSLLLTATTPLASSPSHKRSGRGMEIGLQLQGNPENVVRHKPCVSIFKCFPPTLMAAAIIAFTPLLITPASLGQTIEIQKGASLFRTTCIGCHDAGGNIIQPGATLFTKDLERNGVDSVDKIYQVTYYGKGRMPGFGETCTPRGQCTFGPRLKEEDIRLLAEYVKLKADQGWVDVGKSGD